MHKRILAGVLFLLLIFVQLPTPAHAEATELITRYLINEQPVSGVEFSIYHIASVDKKDFKHFYLDEAYSKYQLDLDVYGDIEKVISLAKLLESYTLRDNLPAVETLKTDENGGIRFSGLTYGIYLLSGQSTTSINGRYTPVPVLFALPYYAEDGSINTSLIARVKHELTQDPITQRVLISWQEDQFIGEDQRPDFVTVQLLRNGIIVDEVSVSKEMGWTYTWEGLDPEYNWVIVQKDVPSIYEVSASQNGITYLFTNTAKGSPEPSEPDDPAPPTPGTPEEPEGPGGHYVRPQTNPSAKPDRDIPTVRPTGGGGVSDFTGITIEGPNTPLDKGPVTPPTEKPGEPNTEITDPQTPKDKLPQTGQLWWPVPVLLIIGLLSLLGSIKIKPRYE